MNKFHLKLWLSATLLVIYGPVFAQKYSIQLAAFTEQIEPSFFSFAGFKQVQHQQNPFNMHQYSWGNFATLAEAQNQLKEFSQNPLLKEFNNLNILASPMGFSIPTTDANTDNNSPVTDFQIFSRSIYIQSKTRSIQKIDVAILEEVATILKKHPTLKLRIIIPERLGQQPSSTNATDVVEHFLLAQNIPAYRIKTIVPLSNQTASLKQTSSSRKQQVIMTLVDLKEEIILDNFGNNGLIVKQGIHGHNSQVLD